MEALKPQDIVVALKLAVDDRPRPAIAELAADLHLSASETHAALRRLAGSHLFDPHERRVVRPALLEFLLHGLRYAFPARPGERTVGLPTAASAAPLCDALAPAPEETLVWGWGSGTVRGHQVEPLYRTVPEAASADPSLHELLALADALRVGRARERRLAGAELERRLKG